MAQNRVNGRAGSLDITCREEGVKDITRVYFDHPVWRRGWGDPVPDMPLDVQLELINRCNLECSACPIGHQSRPRTLLTPEVLRRIADEAAEEGVGYFTVCGIGEASLHPYLFPFLRYVREKKVRPRGLRTLTMMPTVLISNAVWREEQVRECIDSPPDLLSLSLAGLTDDEIRERRSDLDVDGFYRAVRRIFEQRRVRRDEDGGVAPVIHISTHVYPYEMTSRQADIEAFRRKWLGVSDAVVIKPTMLDYRHREYSEFWNRDVDAEGLRYTKLTQSAFERTAPCLETSRRLSINSDGNVWCGHHLSEDFGGFLGNVYESSLREIWHGPRMNEFRRQVRAGIFERPNCRACGGEIRDYHRTAPLKKEDRLAFDSPEV